MPLLTSFTAVAALTSRTTPAWLGVVLAPIPGWRYLPSFAKEYSRSTLQLAGLGGPENASPVQLIKKGGPRKCHCRSLSTIKINHTTAEDILQAHHDKVRSVVPKDQLLEMDLGEGWEPLCKFLGVPVLDEPFPQANDAAAADHYATKVLLKVFAVWVGIFSVAGTMVYGLWRTVGLK